MPHIGAARDNLSGGYRYEVYPDDEDWEKLSNTECNVNKFPWICGTISTIGTIVGFALLMNCVNNGCDDDSDVSNSSSSVNVCDSQCTPTTYVFSIVATCFGAIGCMGSYIACAVMKNACTPYERV